MIAYANSIKTSSLGVRAAFIVKHGAVSSECAEMMARGARKTAGTDIAISITGVAGPDGGTKRKPVGTVHVCVAGPGSALRGRRHIIHGPREAVRSRAVTAALALLKEPLDARA